MVDQDEKDIYIAMRATYLEFGTFELSKIKHQVKLLNNKVIETIIPGMLSEVEQYYGYLREINNPIKPIDLPINASSGGRKTLPSFTTIWRS